MFGRCSIRNVVALVVLTVVKGNVTVLASSTALLHAGQMNSYGFHFVLHSSDGLQRFRSSYGGTIYEPQLSKHLRHAYSLRIIAKVGQFGCNAKCSRYLREQHGCPLSAICTESDCWTWPTDLRPED